MRIKDFKLEYYDESDKFVVTIPEGTEYTERHINSDDERKKVNENLKTKEEFEIILIKYNNKLVEFKKAFTKESSLIFLDKFELSKDKTKFIQIENVERKPLFTYYEFSSENITIKEIGNQVQSLKEVSHNVFNNRINNQSAINRVLGNMDTVSHIGNFLSTSKRNLTKGRKKGSNGSKGSKGSKGGYKRKTIKRIKNKK